MEMIKTLFVFSAILLIMIFVGFGFLFCLIKIVELIASWYGIKDFFIFISLLILAIVLIALEIFLAAKVLPIEEVNILFS